MHICTFGYDLVDSPGGWALLEVNGEKSGIKGAEFLRGSSLDQERNDQRWRWMQLMHTDDHQIIRELRPRDVVPQYAEQTRRDLAKNLETIQAQDLPTAHSMRLLHQTVDQWGLTLKNDVLDEVVAWSQQRIPSALRRAQRLKLLSWLQDQSIASFDEHFPDLSVLDGQYDLTREQWHQHQRDSVHASLALDVGMRHSAVHPDLGVMLQTHSHSTRRARSPGEILDVIGHRVHRFLHYSHRMMPTELMVHLNTWRQCSVSPSVICVGDEQWENSLYLHPGHVCTHREMIDTCEAEIQGQHVELQRVTDDKVDQKVLIPDRCQAPYMVWNGDHHEVLQFLSNAEQLAAQSGLCDLDRFPLVAVKARFGWCGEHVDILPIRDPYRIIRTLSAYKSGFALLELFVPSVGPRQSVMRLLDDVAFDQDGNHQLLYRVAYWRSSPLTHAEAVRNLNGGFRVNYSNSTQKAIPESATKDEIASAAEVADEVMGTVSEMFRTKRLPAFTSEQVAA